MTKELNEVLQRMKTACSYSLGISLDKIALRLILKYINDLEKAIAEGYEDIEYFNLGRCGVYVEDDWFEMKIVYTNIE